MEDQGSPQRVQSPLHNVSIHSPMNESTKETPIKSSSSSSKGSSNVKKQLLSSPKSKSTGKSNQKGKEKDKGTMKTKKGKDGAKGKTSSKDTPNSKGGKSDTTTPNAKATANDAKSSAKKKILSASAKKKKLGDLKEKESAIKEALDKLKKEKTRWDGKLNKLMSITAPVVKFPVKDELIQVTDPSGKPSLPLPEPYINLGQYSQDLLTDAIGVWDFLNVFCKQLGILSISWEDFMDLMKFNSRASAAFLDLYCGPLKLILSDPTLSSKLSQAMPKKANMNAFVTGIVSDKPSETTTISTNPDDFDNCYNGLKLVPKKLRPEMVDALRCQCIIRVVLLRLEPVKNLRKAVAEVSSALHMMQSVSNSNADLNMEKLNQVNREYWSGASQQKSVRFNNIITPQKTLSEKSSINTLELSAETMVLINTPKSKSKSKANGLNKDAIFNITSDCVSRLEEIYNVARALEGTELHMLSLHDKIILLKVLCDACYDSKRIRELLENHADERATKIQEMNRMKREQNAKLKEISATKKQAALEACRKLNMEAAHKKETSTGSKSKSKKAVTKAQSNSSAKDNFDPSTEQLNAMIDDLIMLEAYGIDTVIEDISIEETDSDDEEDSKREEDSNEEEDEGEYLGSRRFAVASRAKALDRKKATAERVQRNSLIVLSYEKIAYAMETKNERDLRGAIKAAERAGFKGINENDEVYCTQMLKQVYRLMHEIESKAKEDKASSQHERALQEYFVRTEPIGTDRNNSIYWHFIGEDNKLFVQERQFTVHYDGAVPPSSGKETDEILCKVFNSRPNRFSYNWKVYTTPTELWRLWEALDDRGEREKMLKDAIKARFEMDEPAAVYQTSGSDWIGKKVQRKFGKKVVVGTIVGWLPPTDEDPPLWHVFHNDGDEEDLEEHEVVEGLWSAEGKEEKMDIDDEAESALEVASNAIVTEAVEDNPSKNDQKNEEELEQQEPKLAKQNYGVSRGNHYSRGLPPLVGSQGIRTELSRLIASLMEPIKKRGGNLNRESRKNLESLVRVSETAKDFSGILLEIEELVRAIQTCEDKLDSDEILARQEEDKQSMLVEGWSFDQNESNFIGRWARRFFKGFGASDGLITAFLKDEDGVVFRMVHQDGDWEDLSLDDLTQALHNFDENLLEDENDDADSSDEDDGSSEENDDEDDGEIFKVDDVGNRLWPSKEIRQLWIEAVTSASSASEISVALSVLEKQFYYFGVLDNVDPTTPLTLFKDPTQFSGSKNLESKSSSYKSATGGHHSMLSPRKAKKRAIGEISRVNKEMESDNEYYDSKPSNSKRVNSNNSNQVADFYNSGRPSRSAAQRVASYAE